MNNTDKTVGTVLLADDEEMVIETSTELLQALAYEVLAARGGQEAIRFARKTRNKSTWPSLT